jgi:FkbM family methyltransferase
MIANKDVLDKFITIQEVIKPDISIEVGAHDADFSKRMIYAGIECFAFEASPYVFERYKQDLKEINYINSAISDKNGTIKFEVQPHEDPSLVGNNSIKNRNELNKYSYVDVHSVTLSDYFKDSLFSKGVLWIDAEGSSGEVLMGLGSRVKDFASIYIELELHDFWIDSWKRDDVVKYLEANGFYLFYEVPCYSGQTDAIFINNRYKVTIDEALSK